MPNCGNIADNGPYLALGCAHTHASLRSGRRTSVNTVEQHVPRTDGRAGGRTGESADSADTAVPPWPPRPFRTPARERAEVLAVISVGGVIGACARYGASLLWPTPPGEFPWSTFWVNVTGCAAMGILMVLAGERLTARRRLLRPFLGTGFLGGCTTFSTATLDTQRFLDGGHPGTGLLYAAATLTAAVAAAWATAALTRLIVLPRTPAERGQA